MSLLLALDSSVSFELSSTKFRSLFRIFVNFGTSRHSYFFKLYSLSLNTGMDYIPFVSVYIEKILLVLAANMYRK